MQTVGDDSHRARGRLRNRERLLDAGFAVLAEKGPAAAASEVTQRAGLAVGTFYNHFADKEELLTAVEAEAVAAHSALLDWAAAAGADSATRLGLAVRASVLRAARLPAWASFIGHFGLIRPSLRTAVAGGAHRIAELAGGTAQIAATAGVVVALSLSARQDGGGDAEAEAAALAVLALLGVDAAAARRAVSVPLPG